MAIPYPQDNPFLRGPFEPLRMECDYADLIVEGVVPEDLRGSLYRIGPNPQFAPRGVYNPLQGDGMAHRFYIEAGRVSYRNRWVKTRRWALEREAGRALFSTSDPRDTDPSVSGEANEGAANTHIVHHAGRLLALEEGHAPIEMDAASLATLGLFDFDGRLPGNMTAHPKTDPETGELLFFANFPNRAFDGELAVHTADASGRLIRSLRIPGPYPALVHDFAITRDHTVFIVCPATLSLARLQSGQAPIAWEPDLGTYVGLLPRQGDGSDVRWFAAPPCMVWHTLNAFEEAGRIVLDVCQQAAPAFPSATGAPTPEDALRQYLTRLTIDPASGAVSARRLSEIVCEYPRIDERVCGRPYRYGFLAALGGPGTDDPCHRALARFDHATSRMQVWRARPHEAVSEPVFAARPGSTGEGVGYLLATIFDERRNASHLAILDAEEIEQGPIARAYLDHRVPAGFHGSFVASTGPEFANPPA
jgi:carotenoid cleavage dioxygenase